MFGLVKPDSSLRPVSIVNVVVKIAATLLMSNVNAPKLVGKSQYGFGLSKGPQICAQRIQRYLSRGFVVVKTDVEDAFGTVDRRLLAAMLFDTPATKPLWRYFHMRYERYATHHVFGAEYDGTIRSSVGLNQGDPISSFLFAFFVSDLRVPSAVEVMQIHDDTYVVTTPDKVDSCLSELQEYYRGKQLRLRPQKTKILDGSMSFHVKIGEGYVHARGIPIPPATVEMFDFLPMLQQLPLQHSASARRISWRYCGRSPLAAMFTRTVNKSTAIGACAAL